ncbi:MAG: translation initiation factor IF-3 [Alphaproteobacteria bacterium]|nr:translation initiation factor IF-3 [Alphaproteobacteria bacterium]
MRSTPSKDGPRANHEITASQVRVINAQGDMLGVMPKAQAIRMAEEVGLDLVEISPNAEPPVCKFIDYGKYKYEAQKKANEARKKQKVVEIKEIKMRPTIDKHDYDIKVRALLRFIEEGDKVKISLRFRGRENSHKEVGFEVFKRLEVELQDKVKIEQSVRFEGGNQLMMLVGPK